jgi:hypothetical protein
LAGRTLHHFKLNNTIYKYIPLWPKNPYFLKKKQKKVRIFSPDRSGAMADGSKAMADDPKAGAAVVGCGPS